MCLGLHLSGRGRTRIGIRKTATAGVGWRGERWAVGGRQKVWVTVVVHTVILTGYAVGGRQVTECQWWVHAAGGWRAWRRRVVQLFSSRRGSSGVCTFGRSVDGDMVALTGWGGGGGVGLVHYGL